MVVRIDKNNITINEIGDAVLDYVMGRELVVPRLLSFDKIKGHP